MPRLRQVPRAEASPEALKAYDRLFGDRDPVVEPGTATGTPGNWWTVFALVPDVLVHAQDGFALLNSRRRTLTPYQRELALVRTGFAAGSQFVFSQHCKAARAAGVPEEKIAAIPAWGVSPVFDAADRAILAYTDDLVLQDGRVQDATFAALREVLSDEAILELTYAVATYRMHATICRALRLEYDDVDERIVEVPAPGQGGAAFDVMGQIQR
ncbi:carboxymuconolactone decarboxylase family protein [Tepidiforma bonchosmolovskayae]|jgi:alkylhydroperoxidase family enzyme|uniref:Carboxymuconolactone decarboxylase family protein n=1 Tax=Tepidiforma bonchosmolovskayae TaxID=2601677 RepID=A0ABX6C399_9CHLR|nr:carboxymuconolactone decarboxylase family protein [Tepidiforma bonchosmolovskayae]QFG03548.1 carboxymuconolactone decarboxylase family protein [Tepidiforma bonchosmolovskayae]